MNFRALLKSLLLRKFSTALLIVQIALTIALVVNTQVLTTAAMTKLNEPLGFDPSPLLITAQQPTTKAFGQSDFAKSIIMADLNKLSSDSEISGAAYFSQQPVGADQWLVNIQDINLAKNALIPAELTAVPYIGVSPTGLSTMGLKLIQGRYPDLSDDADHLDSNRMSDRNIVITHSLAKTLYPKGSALGRKTSMGSIVGIVEDYQVNPTWDGPKRYFAIFTYAIFTDIADPRFYVLKTSSANPATVLDRIGTLILSVHPERYIHFSYPLTERVKQLFEREFALANLFWFLSGLMLLVTAISSFSHANFHVSKQTKIIGIRRALGARKKDILWLVFTESWLLYGIGTVAGLIAIVGLNIGLGEVIDIAKPGLTDVLLGIGVIFIFGSVATWLPAVKSTRISPIVATVAT